MRGRALALTLILLSGASAAAPPKRLDVTLKCGPDGAPEGMTIGDKAVDLRGGDAFERIKAVIGKDRPPVHLLAGMETPYRCIGGVIFAMQRLGFTKVGFIAEPPEDGPER